MDREAIARLVAQGVERKQIAVQLGCNPSTITRALNGR